MPFDTNIIQTEDSDYSYSYPEDYPISDAAKDLIDKLLEPDPKIRLGADEILKHPWFVTLESISEEDLDFLEEETDSESKYCKCLKSITESQQVCNKFRN